MLTSNRRDKLKKRDSLDTRDKSVYDYHILKWLQIMLDSGPEGGIGDVNRVLDTLDRETIHKHLKDENVYDLFKLVVRLLDILDFAPIEQTSRGQAIVTSRTGIRRANDADFDRNICLSNHVNHLKAHYAESEAVRQFEGHVLAYAMEMASRLGHKTPSKEEIEKFMKDYNMGNEPQEGGGATY